MNDMRIKIFANDLRRCLYLGQLLKECLEDLKLQGITPSWMKSDANNIMNAIKRLRVDCDRGNQTQRIIEDDLNKEQLRDICLLLDAVADLSDVQQITDIINECKIRDKKETA